MIIIYFYHCFLRFTLTVADNYNRFLRYTLTVANILCYRLITRTLFILNINEVNGVKTMSNEVKTILNEVHVVSTSLK